MLWGDCGYLLFSKFAVRKNIILTSELNMDRAHTAGLRIWSAIIRTAVVFMMLLPFSFTAFGHSEDITSPEKERTRGDFTVNINLAFPVFSSGPETYGYEAVGFGYTFLNNNLEAGINLGGIVTKGTLYTDSRMRGMAMGTAYLSLLFGKKTGKLTICPTIETGVGYGTTNRVRESTRAVFGVSTTLLYRPLKWFHTGIDLKYVFLSNSDNRWLMLGFKFGVDF